MTHSILRPAVVGALSTALSLVGGLLLGIMAGNLVFNLLPGHNFTNPNPVSMAIAAIPALAGMFAGSALWGVLMGRLARSNQWQRMALAGGLSFAPIAITIAIALQLIEPIALRTYGAWLPLHRLFTVLFVPSAFIIAGLSAWGIGLGLRNQRLAWQLLWQVGLVAALAFLIVNLVMEASGWVVGGPRAAERFTMLTVMSLGNLGAALAGGAVLGVGVAPKPRALPEAHVLSGAG